jgi:hypothetical protein
MAPFIPVRQQTDTTIPTDQDAIAQGAAGTFDPADDYRNVRSSEMPVQVTTEKDSKVGTKTGKYPTTRPYTDAEGNVRQQPAFYNVDDDAFYFLKSLGDVERGIILSNLYRKGAYEGRTPGNGLSSADIFAFGKVLKEANYEGAPWQNVYASILGRPDFVQVSGGGARVRLTNPDDIKYVLNQTAQKLLGRSVDDVTAQRFVDAVQAEERRSAYGGSQAADMGVQAEEQIKQQFAAEERASRMADFAGVMDQMIKGLAV